MLLLRDNSLRAWRSPVDILSFGLSDSTLASSNFYGSREGTVQKYFANPKKYFKSQYFSQITVEKFDKSKKLLKILRKFVDPQITFSIIRKYFANP